MSKKNANQKKKKNHTGCLIFLIFFIIASVTLFMFWKFGDGFGFSLDFWNKNNNNDNSSGTSQVSEISDINSESGLEDNKILIIISGSSIKANNQDFNDTESLKQYLLSINDENTEYILRDNHAVKSVYSDAKNILDELSYKYNEEIAD